MFQLVAINFTIAVTSMINNVFNSVQEHKKPSDCLQSSQKEMTVFYDRTTVIKGTPY